VQTGSTLDKKQNVGGACYGWKVMGGNLVDLLARVPCGRGSLELEHIDSADTDGCPSFFAVTVIANFAALGLASGQPPAWVTYSPLLPLALLLFTGLYLFVLPYATRWRGGR
jgi:hypothetical protein